MRRTASWNRGLSVSLSFDGENESSRIFSRSRALLLCHRRHFRN